MKNQFYFLLLTIFCIGFCACSDNDDNDNDPTKELVEIDYIANLGYAKDITINTDGAVYALAYDELSRSTLFSLKKVSSDGSVSILNNSLGDYFGNTVRLTNTPDGKLYLTSDMSSDRNKIITFSKDFSKIETIEIRGSDGPYAPKPRLMAIAPFENNSLVVFDVSYHQLKRYYFSLGKDILMAGSEKDEIKDGTGLEAGFSFVNRIISFGGVLYVLDKSKYIRLIEKKDDGMPKVTTIFAESPIDIQDMALDLEGNFYLATYRGLYTLRKGSKNIELITQKDNIDVKTKKGELQSLYLSSIKNLYIKGSDLYLITGYGVLTKMSDFKNKLQELKNKGSL